MRATTLEIRFVCYVLSSSVPVRLTADFVCVVVVAVADDDVIFAGIRATLACVRTGSVVTNVDPVRPSVRQVCRRRRRRCSTSVCMVVAVVYSYVRLWLVGRDQEALRR